MKLINAEIQFALVAEDEYNAKIVLKFEGRAEVELLLTSVPKSTLDSNIKEVLENLEEG